MDTPYVRRLGAGSAVARSELRDLADRGLIEPVRARGGEPYRLAAALDSIRAMRPARALPLGAGSHRIVAGAATASDGVSDAIVTALRQHGSLARHELDEITGCGRSKVTAALAELIKAGAVRATAPPRSPRRRYVLGGLG